MVSCGRVWTAGAGTHNYTIQSADGNGNAATPYTGSFNVVSPSGVTVSISSVAVVDTKTNGGTLLSTDPVEITWAVNGAASVGSKSLSVDGKAVTAIYGPYSAGANTWYLGGTFGPLGAGSHNYTIQSADGNGNAATPYTGSFNVVSPSGVTVSISSVAVVDAKTNGGTLLSTDPVEITWAVNGAASVGSKSLSVDGKAVTTMYGPYSAGANTWYLGGEFGPLGRRRHLQHPVGRQ